MKIDAATFFELAGFAIGKLKPSVYGTLPTVADLEADVHKLWDAQDAKPKEVVVLGQPSVAGELSKKAASIPSGCMPCSIGHLGTCSGLLNEAMRFARKDGVASEEVISRVNMCLDELNALERVDLRPEMIVELPHWESPMAEKALDLSRSLRHDLEALSSVSELQQLAAKTQTTRQEIGKSWFRERFSRMSPEQQKLVEERLRAKEAETHGDKAPL